MPKLTANVYAVALESICTLAVPGFELLFISAWCPYRPRYISVETDIGDY
jgi:hypothetical protein